MSPPAVLNVAVLASNCVGKGGQISNTNPNWTRAAGARRGPDQPVAAVRHVIHFHGASIQQLWRGLSPRSGVFTPEDISGSIAGELEVFARPLIARGGALKSVAAALTVWIIVGVAVRNGMC